MPLIPADAFPFCGPTYLAASPIIDAQRSINLYPEPGIGSSKTQMALIGRPGMSQFSTWGASGPGHSLWAGAGRLFAALGGSVYEVTNGGGILTNYGTGLSAGSAAPMPMIANGTQLLICDPVAGKIFNINPGGPSLDSVFNGVALEYLDGFYVAIATGASLAGTNPNQINASINGDGTNWPALSFAIETTAADLIIQLSVLNGLLYIFGQKTLRVWYDAGNNIFPFARVNGGQVNLGCLAAQTVVKFSNTILWLGSDQTGYGQVYMMQGMNPVKVSNPAIETMISSLVSTNSSAISHSTAYGYQEAGHTFYVLQLCTQTFYQAALTLVYDLTTGLWHERTYDAGIVPCSFANVQGFGSSNRANFVIDKQTGGIWYQSILIPNDFTANIIYQRTAPHIGSENRWFKYPRFVLDIDPQNSTPGTAGTIAPILDYSNDGGRSFLGYNYPMAQNMDQGDAQGLQRFYALQLGRSRDRVFKVSITDSTNLIRIANAYLTAEVLS